MRTRAALAAALVVGTSMSVISLASPSSVAHAAGPPTQYISDLPWSESTNGYGPAERDTSSGGEPAGDGVRLRMGDKSWAKGLGVHSRSVISVAIGANTRFLAQAGIDNEVGRAGSGQFQVWADGTKLFESSVRHGGDAPVPVWLDIAGRKTLSLIMLDGGDGGVYDHGDWANARMTAPTTTTPPPPTGTLLFNADVAHRGLGAYAAVIHPERISVVDDPVLGASRKVMKFTVYDSDTGPTDNPRAQVETAKSWGEGADIYVGWSTLFPTGWPAQLAPGGATWITLEEVYGEPYAGASPVKLGMRSGTPALTIQRNTSYNWDIPWEKGPIQDNRWYDFVLHEKLSQDPSVGFVEMWMNTGAGYQRQSLLGQDTLHMKTLDGANNGGLNYSALKLYRQKGMFDVLTVYQAEHKVGTTFDVVAPHSYG